MPEQIRTGQAGNSQTPAESKKTKKRGNHLGFWFFRSAVRFFGLKRAYELLHFVCPYYLLFDRAAVASAMPYVKRRFPGRGIIGRHIEVYRLFLSQGRNLIDRHYLMSGAGPKFDIELLGYDRIKSILQGGINSQGDAKGFVMLTAHVGNWQTSMDGLELLKTQVHLMMKPEMNEAVRLALDVDGSGERVSIISPDGYLGGVIEALNAIKKGDIVSIMGDRAYGAETVDVEFMGGTVRFPYGGFSIAASAGCPVVVLLTAKDGANRVIVDASTVIEPVYTDRRNKMADIKRWVREFAKALEGYVERHPYQWFVFDDIWADEAANEPVDVDETKTE